MLVLKTRVSALLSSWVLLRLTLKAHDPAGIGMVLMMEGPFLMIVISKVFTKSENLCSEIQGLS